MLIVSFCLPTLVYAADPPSDITLLREVTETEQDDDKTLIEKSTAVIIPSGKSFGGWSFSGSGDADHPITLTKDGTSMTDGKIQVEAPDGKVYELPLYGNLLYSADGGYAINLYSVLDGYDDSDGDFKITIVDNAGNVSGSKTLSITESTTTEEEPGLLATLWKLLTDPVQTVATMVEEIMVELLLPLGDGLVYLISKSVGEVVTTGRLVYNKVDRVSVDYWNITPGTTTVRGMMAKVVTPWYNFFRQIATIVYMMTLLVIGIKIMFSSTADQKAKFKDTLTSWVVGVAILTMFPYVMKYVVTINNTMVQSIHDYANSTDATCANPKILNVTTKEAFKMFGKSSFVENMLSENPAGGSTIDAATIRDSMMRVRLYAQYKKKVILTAVYFIMIGQMIVILFMYYKRAFMIAFLITLFPLVAMTYVLDKMGDKKAQSFEIWFKEFVVNVIVQLFHAVVYAVVVGLGVEKYMTDDGSWLFMIISILFLFEGEKILRGIFNVKSAANSVGDLAATGLAVYGVAKGAKGLFKGEKDSGGRAQDKKDMKGIEQRQAQRLDMNQGGGANAAKTPPGGGGSGGSGGSGGGSDGSYDKDNEPAGVGTPGGSDPSAAKDQILKTAMQRRTKRGLASRMIKSGSKIAGAGIAATYGLSKGDTAGGSAIGNALTSAAVGSSIAGTLTAPVSAVANKIEQRAQGNKTAKKIEQGQMDDIIAQSIPADVDPKAVIGKHGETVQEIYKQALAEMARVSATKGKAKAEKAYWSYIDEHTKSKS